MKQPPFTNLFIATIFQQVMKIFLISFLLSACMNKSKINRNEQLAGMYKLYNIQKQKKLWHLLYSIKKNK
jgi:hypothetical protein